MKLINKNRSANTPSELSLALSECRAAFISVGVFSAFINFFWLTPSIYMMQVYDRVLMSRNDLTLLMLTLIITFLFAVMSSLEWVRSQILIRASNRIDSILSEKVFTSTFRMSLRGMVGNAPQALGDLAAVRQFLTGQGLFAFFDAPWLPIYLIAIFFINFWMGVFAISGMIILAALAYSNEIMTRKPLQEAGKMATFSSEQAGSQLRNAEVIQAMGMLPQLKNRWLTLHRSYLGLQADASQKAATNMALTKFFRMLFQSLILGIGALLVIQDQMTAGAMIAGSILLGRALSPLEQVLAISKQFSIARQAYQRLDHLLEEGNSKALQINLPPPSGAIQVQDAAAVPPGGKIPVLANVNFELSKGQVLVVLGPSGSGKSSLARLLVGVWPAVHGKIRFDGADISQWDPARLGIHMGYLPQDIELFNGTIAENIARFTEINSEKIIDAAVTANVHDLVLQMPDGYETRIGPGAYQMSGGQQQRIALARALYDDPKILVLDEPNSNLDQAGEQALVVALQNLKQRGTTVIVITHRTNILQIATHVLVLAAGRVAAFGPPESVLNSGSVRVVSPSRTA